MKRRRKVKQAHRLKHLRTRAYHAQNGKCYWCGNAMQPDKVTADHVVPQYAGGQTWPGNIVAACAPCNSQRTLEANHRPKSAPAFRAGTDDLVSPFAALAKLKEG